MPIRADNDTEAESDASADSMSLIIEKSAALRQLGFRMLARFQPYRQSRLSRPDPAPDELFAHWFVHILHVRPEEAALPVLGVTPPPSSGRLDLITRYYLTDLLDYLPDYVSGRPAGMSEARWRALLYDICQTGTCPVAPAPGALPDEPGERFELPAPTLYHMLLRFVYEWKVARDIGRPLSANAAFLERAVGKRGAEALFGNLLADVAGERGI